MKDWVNFWWSKGLLKTKFNFWSTLFIFRSSAFLKDQYSFTQNQAQDRDHTFIKISLKIKIKIKVSLKHFYFLIRPLRFSPSFYCLDFCRSLKFLGNTLLLKNQNIHQNQPLHFSPKIKPNLSKKLKLTFKNFSKNCDQGPPLLNQSQLPLVIKNSVTLFVNLKIMITTPSHTQTPHTHTPLYSLTKIIESLFIKKVTEFIKEEWGWS